MELCLSITNNSGNPKIDVLRMEDFVLLCEALYVYNFSKLIRPGKYCIDNSPIQLKSAFP